MENAYLFDAELAEMLQAVDVDCRCVFCGEIVDEEPDHAADCELLRLIQEVREYRHLIRLPAT